jgi:hypothetical protein
MRVAALDTSGKVECVKVVKDLQHCGVMVREASSQHLVFHCAYLQGTRSWDEKSHTIG